MKVFITGTSNSLLSDGYTSYLKNFPDMDVDNFAICPSSCAIGLFLIEDIPVNKYDFAIIDHRINDQAAMEVGILTSFQVEAYFTSLIAATQSRGAIPIVIICPVNARNWQVADMHVVRNIQKEVSARLGAYYVDLQSLYDEVVSRGAQAGNLMRDHYHMNSEFAELLSKLLANTMRSIQAGRSSGTAAELNVLSLRRVSAREMAAPDRISRLLASRGEHEIIRVTSEEDLVLPVVEGEVLRALFVNRGAFGAKAEISTKNQRIVKNFVSYFTPRSAGNPQMFLMELAEPVNGAAEGIRLRIVEKGSPVTEKTAHGRDPLPDRYGVIELSALLVSREGGRVVNVVRQLNQDIPLNLQEVSLFKGFSEEVLALGRRPTKVETAARKSNHPYAKLESRAFWRSAVADVDAAHVSGLWEPKFAIDKQLRFATAGSCFAQHLSRALMRSGYAWIDGEPAPNDMPAEKRSANGYGVFSFRVGNIYNCELLLQWVRWAEAGSIGSEEVWEENGRFYDPFRPAIVDKGFASRQAVLDARKLTLDAIAKTIRQTDIFVFTLGLTEGWRNVKTRVVYPLCPGTTGGRPFDPGSDKFVNYSTGHTKAYLARAMDEMKRANPSIRFLLTVSPVPLTATASGNHVLVATTYSKSSLRAAAGELASEREDTDYFPSYEIIASPPFGGRFYALSKREVRSDGVDFVMSHFFAGVAAKDKASEPTRPSSLPPVVVEEEEEEDQELACEEAFLEAFNRA